MDFKPVILPGKEQADELVNTRRAAYADLVPHQLLELYTIYNLASVKNKKDIPASAGFKAYTGEIRNYTLVYYPWLNKVIRTVDENDFYILKTNRNKDLVREDEQKILKGFTVAVLGLSVGSNIASLLTQAGISNKIFLADPDSFDTSNMNRIFAGVNEVGVNKAIIAARKIYEGNPYADVVPMTEGANEQNLEELLKKEQINCIVEEVDSIPVKIATRRLALKYKVPVIMITDNGFRIILHLERYDLGHDKIFEKDPAYWDFIFKEELDIQKVSEIIIKDIIGDMSQVDPRLLASAPRIYSKELVSWPQLGSTAMLGGVVVTQMLKKMALKETNEPFIKRFINLDI